MNFHICPICRKPSFREQKLCRPCARRLHSHCRLTIRREQLFTVKSLFSWDEDSPQGLTDLIYGLKGAEDAQAWLELALWMVQKFSFRL